jgi:hypothetical protein
VEINQEKAEREGFEPSVGLRPHRFSRPDLNSPKDQVHLQIQDGQSSGVPVVVPSPSLAVSDPQFPPDLAHVMSAWDHLPGAIKAAILALVEAVQAANEPQQDD